MAVTYEAFLSYAHYDNHDGRVSEFCERLEKLLFQRLGREFHVFQDKTGLATGDLWEQEIAKALDSSVVLIALITPSFFNRPWCRREVATFLDLKPKQGKVAIIIPIYWLDAPLMEDHDALKGHPIAPQLLARQYDDWRDVFDYALSSEKVRPRMTTLTKEIVNKLKENKLSIVAPTPTAPEPIVYTPSVSVSPPKAPKIRARPKPKRAWLQFLNVPEEVELIVNGKLFENDLYEVSLPEGTLSVELEVVAKAPGYETEEWDIELFAGQTAELPIALTKLPESIIRSRRVSTASPLVFTPPLTLAEYKAQMVTIPAGKFQRGSTEYPDEQPVREIYLSEFQIGIVPVTVAMYQEFVQANPQYKSEGANKAGQLPTAPPGFIWQGSWDKVLTHPMVNVSWNDALAFAQWAGLTLPTEAQWERTACSTDGRRFPWGNEWNTQKCRCSTKAFGDSGGTAPVGSYPDGESIEGVLDMSGNVWEWCLDWYGEDYYKTASDNDPRGPENGEYRVLRGGSWYYNYRIFFRCAGRYRYNPAMSNNLKGFRLVSPAPN